jgi:multisubunit Na+/H+ antiporter MnhG subunit
MVKLLFLLALFFFVAPVATHALAQAALHSGVGPRLTEDRTARLETTSSEGRTS